MTDSSPGERAVNERWVAIRERGAQYAGIATRVLEVGGSGRPFVLFHGFSDSADTWRPVLAGLHAAGRRGIAVDLPGFGRAGRRRRGPMLGAFDPFVAEVLRAGGGEEGVVAVGNSLGGCLALRAAQDVELPLAGVVPIAPGGLGHSPWVDRIERDRVVGVLLRAPVPVPSPLVRTVVTRAFKRMIGRGRPISDDLARRYASHNPTIGRWRRQLVDGRRLLGELRPGAYEFERIGVPVLIVHGARDQFVQLGESHELFDRVPHAQLRVLEHSAHCPQVDDPALVTRLLLEFDTALRPGAATDLAPA